MTQTDIDTLVELYEGNNSIQNAIRRVDLPKTWPALHTMRVDEKSRLWVSTIIDERGIYKWWVINESGKVAGTFDWPGSEPVVYVRDGAIYTKKTGNKGISQILKYRMEGL